MSNISRYISYQSGTLDSGESTSKSLSLLVVTKSNKILPNNIYTFNSLNSLIDVFSSGDEEYKIASTYFGYVSPNQTRPNKINFLKWADSATSATVLGGPTSSLATIQAITAGKIKIISGGTLITDAMDFSSATSFSDVASTIQTEVRKGGGAQFTQASVVYDSVSKGFNLTLGTTGVAKVEVQNDDQDNTATILGLTISAGAKNIDGSNAQSIDDVLVFSDNNNYGSTSFGSIYFLPDLTDDEKLSAVKFANDTKNFVLCIGVTLNNYETSFITYGAYDNVVASIISTNYDQIMPAIVAGAINYDLVDSDVSFLFRKLASATPLNITESVQSDLIKNRANHFIKSGNLVFFESGDCYGDKQCNVVYGEVWLKYKVVETLKNLISGTSRLPSNSEGVLDIKRVLTDVALSCLSNGIFEAGKTLSETQRIEVDQITGVDGSWRNVQNDGYFIDIKIQDYQDESGITKKKAVVRLVYSKDDLINKIEVYGTLV